MRAVRLGMGGCVRQRLRTRFSSKHQQNALSRAGNIAAGTHFYTTPLYYYSTLISRSNSRYILRDRTCVEFFVFMTAVIVRQKGMMAIWTDIFLKKREKLKSFQMKMTVNRIRVVVLGSPRSGKSGLFFIFAFSMGKFKLFLCILLD